MTTPKCPTSLESAIAMACGPLGGFGNAALAFGYPESRFSHAANPNKPDGIRFDDALRLDRACAEAGGGTPIFAYYQRQIEGQCGPDLDPHEHLARVSEAAAPLQAGLARALADGRISRDEAKTAVRDIGGLVAILTSALADFSDLVDEGG